MDSLRITKSILSITSPGTHLVNGDDKLARRVTRECNEFAADLKQRKPDRFGFWASLPLPDVEGSLEELAFSLDKLNADGVCMETNHHGVYLGDPKLEPVFAELNRRKSTIFIHPTSPHVLAHGGGCHSGNPLSQYPAPMFEFFFETARAAINLFLSGTVSRHPNITYVLSHAGGALPPLIERFSSIPRMLGLGIDVSPETVKKGLKQQFFFDLAGFPFPDQINGLLPHVTAAQLLYGTDYCYTPGSTVTELASVMDERLKELFPKEEDRRAVYVGNAMKLLKGKA